MDTLRDKVIKLAHANPELRVHLLPIIKEAKAGKKLKGKKLDKHINSTYSRLGNRIMINMMDIPKIWDASKAAYESGGTAEEADAAMEKAMTSAIQKAKVASTKTAGARPLHEIANDIRLDWGSKVNFAAKPYLQAMFSLGSMKDRYGQDPASSIVAYFLSNARSWRGPVAKAIKAELNKMLKSSY